jgi:peptidase E
MTTYILHGGATSTENEQNDYFFKQFTVHVDKSEVRILLCYFARSEEEWDRLTKRDVPKIEKNTDKKVTYKIAKDPKDLLTKLKNCDVLYVAGGTPNLIEPYYKDLEGLSEALGGKVYIGSSMGAFLCSTSYVISGDSSEYPITSGLGLLPVQVLCHWDVEAEKDLKRRLLLEHSSLPILTLNECQTVEMYR